MVQILPSISRLKQIFAQNCTCTRQRCCPTIYSKLAKMHRHLQIAAHEICLSILVEVYNVDTSQCTKHQQLNPVKGRVLSHSNFTYHNVTSSTHLWAYLSTGTDENDERSKAYTSNGHYFSSLVALKLSWESVWRPQAEQAFQWVLPAQK